MKKVVALLRDGALQLVEVASNATYVELPVYAAPALSLRDLRESPLSLTAMRFTPSGALDPKRREVWTQHGKLPSPEVGQRLGLLRVSPDVRASHTFTDIDSERTALDELQRKLQHALGTTEVQLLSKDTVSVTLQSGRAAAVNTNTRVIRVTARGVLPWMVTP